jgi:DNA-binding transcriptional ArsR family regulator
MKMSLAKAASGTIVNHMVNHKRRELDLVFRALADPTRRQILERLAEGRTRVTGLAQPFSMSLPAVSKHLRVLEAAGLLSRERHGREHVLSLEAGPLKDALRWMERYRRFWEGSLVALAEYVENQQETTRKKEKT